MACHSSAPSPEHVSPFAPILANRARPALGRKNDTSAAVDRWEGEGGLVPGTVPARSPQATISASTTDQADAFACQVILVGRNLASDYADGRVGTRYNTFQHRSRVLSQMRAQLAAMGERGSASIAQEQPQ